MTRRRSARICASRRRRAVASSRSCSVKRALSGEVGLLHDLASAVERAPHTDLLTALERATTHEASVTPKEPPRPVHLSVEVRPTEADRAVVIVVNCSDRSLRRHDRAPPAELTRGHCPLKTTPRG